MQLIPTPYYDILKMHNPFTTGSRFSKTLFKVLKKMFKVQSLRCKVKIRKSESKDQSQN